MDKERIQNAVREILIAVGEDPDREGLLETPKRVANMYEEIFAGLTEDPKQHIKLFNEQSNDEMVIVKDIPFYSMCEHHLLPFFPMDLLCMQSEDCYVSHCHLFSWQVFPPM